MIAPGFQSHQCLAGMWKRWLSCYAGVAPEVNLNECVIHMPPQARIRLPTLALKPRGDITRSPKQGYQWPHKKDSCPPKFFFKKKISFLLHTLIFWDCFDYMTMLDPTTSSTPLPPCVLPTPLPPQTPTLHDSLM